MLIRIQRREQGVHRHGRGAVFVLPDRVQDLPFALFDFLIGKGGLHHDFANQLEHRFEVFREARAGDGHDVPVRAHGERYAPLVERLRNLVGRSPQGAAVDHARCKMAQAKTRVRIVDAPRFDADLNRHRRNGVRLFGNDDGAVIENMARGGKPLLKRCRHSCAPSTGLNQPTVRRSVRRYFFATPST